MTRIGDVDLLDRELDAIAWEFLRSDFTGPAYRSWSLDRRLDVYLVRRGLSAVADDGGIVAALLERVMANVGRALRNGVLSSAGG
jgi:hypothetical protein